MIVNEKNQNHLNITLVSNEPLSKTAHHVQNIHIHIQIILSNHSHFHSKSFNIIKIHTWWHNTWWHGTWCDDVDDNCEDDVTNHVTNHVTDDVTILIFILSDMFINGVNK